MIWVTFADAGTKFKAENPDRTNPTIGLGWYAQEKQYEHYFYEEELNRPHIHETFRDVDQRELWHWSPGMGNHAWVDKTPRYETIEGFFLEQYIRDDITDSFYPSPRVPMMWFDPTYEPPILNPQETITRPLFHHHPAEAATRNPLGLDTTQLVRAPLKNEIQYHGRFRGYTDLKPEFCSMQHGQTGASFVLVNPNDSIIFAPFDFRQASWYSCENEDGEKLTPTEEWLTMRPDSQYVVHLRPRTWRWTVFVLAHYLYISPFYIMPNDEYFTHVFFDRPPFYPYRHDAIHSKQTQGSLNWNNDWRSYDIGIDYYWETTNAAADLARQILQQQYTWYSMAYLFIGNEDPDLFIEAWPPRKGDYVCAIERIDQATGLSSTVFVRQERMLDDVFPDYQFGAFIARWQVVPDERFAKWGGWA